MADVDPYRYVLTDDESATIFRDVIVPSQLGHGVSRDHPTAIFVCAQPGAGKTRAAELIANSTFADQPGAILFDNEAYKGFHPEFARLLSADDTTARAYLAIDGRRWKAMAKRYILEHRFDVVMTARGRAHKLTEALRTHAEAGYICVVAILAVAEPLSRLGLLTRYAEEFSQAGYGRRTHQSEHDDAFGNLRTIAAAVDAGELPVRIVAVYGRSGAGIVELHRGDWLDGRWDPAPGALEALDRERNRLWTTEESEAFTQTLTAVSQQLGAQWQPDIRDLAALATPFLGAAQPPLPGQPR